MTYVTQATRVTFGEPRRELERRVLAEEAPVALRVSGLDYAVMMASPFDLEDFALGFALSEGLADDLSDIAGIALAPAHDAMGAYRVDIDLRGAALSRHLARDRSRNLVGRTGCGWCGLEKAQDLVRAQARVPGPMPAMAIVAQALAQLDQLQPMNAASHAVHAAALFDDQGAVVAVREDVGRHNALDKLIGALVRQGLDAANGFIVITSRCSYEMVEKAAIAGAATLVAVSAPTSLALERAKALGLNLIAVARQDGVLIFNQAGQDLHEAAA